MKDLPSKLFLYLFIAVSVGDLIGIILQNDLVINICKPLIMLSLIGLYFYKSLKVNALFVIAMVFSFFGDVFLLNKDGFFIYGLSAFLVTQVMYLRIFIKDVDKINKSHLLLAILPFAAYFILFIGVLKDGLGDMLIPVVVYGLAISAMGVSAMIRFFHKPTLPGQYLLIGAILFIASDSMIALNTFYESHEFYSIAIMLTYILAQYLICKYMLTREVKVSLVV